VSARCPQCGKPGTWSGSSGLVTDDNGTQSVTDTYQCPQGHVWTSTATYE